MKKTVHNIIFIAFLSILFSCQKKLSISVEGEKIVDITQFPNQDTTIQLQDYWVTYSQTEKGLVGSFGKLPLEEKKGSFESNGKVCIDFSKTNPSVSVSDYYFDF